MRQLNNVTNDGTVQFWINDISLFVPPTSISVHKEGLNYSVKSLRTKSSVKMASGNGVYHIQLNFVFPPDSFLQLHRLICQVKNNPFVYIENDFLHDSLNNDVLNKKGKKIIYATLMGLNITNHPTSPGSFTVEMDLRYFNEKVYSENLGFKQDDLYEFVTEEKVYNVSFDIFNSDVINIIEEKEKELIGSGRFRKRYSLDGAKRKDTIKVSSPYESRVYKRYCNYLQVLYLKKYFNIRIDRKKDTDKEGFIISEIDANLYIKKEIADFLNKGLVGLHEIKIPDDVPFAALYDAPNLLDGDFKRLRQEIIHACYLTSKFTRFNVRSFVSLKIPANDLKSITKILNKGVRSFMTREEKYKRKKENLEALRAALTSLQKSQSVKPGGTKHVRSFLFKKEESRSLKDEGSYLDFFTEDEMKPILETYLSGDIFDPNAEPITSKIEQNRTFKMFPEKKYGYKNINFVNNGRATDSIEAGDPNAYTNYSSWEGYRKGLIVVGSVYVNRFSFVFAPFDCEIIGLDESKSYSESIKLKNEKGSISFSGIIIPEIFRKKLSDLKGKTIPAGTILGFTFPRTLDGEESSSLTYYVDKVLFKTMPFYKTDKTEVSGYKDLVVGDKATIEKLDELFLYINSNYQKYLGRKEVENVFMDERVMSILDFTDYEINQISNMSEGFLGNDFTYGDRTVIANFSGALRNIIANIPILGQEIPTHQFLGSIEPSYQFNLIGKNNLKSMPTTFLELEKMRSDSQYYAKAFSMIPGASFIGVESLITKLLGSYEKSYRNIIEYGEADYISRELIEKYNFSINSMDTYTIEGQPHATGMNLRFDETRDYNEEEIRPAFTNQTNRKSISDLYRKLIEGIPLHSGTQQTKVLSSDPGLYKSIQTNTEVYDDKEGWGKWKTKHYTADEYYRKIRFVESKKRGQKIDSYMKEFNGLVRDYNLGNDIIHPDRSAFYICQVLSQIEDYLQIIYKNKPKSRIFSAIRYTTVPNISIIRKKVGEDEEGNPIYATRKGSPSTLTEDEEIVRPYRSMHFSGGAVDIYKSGVNATELVIYIYLMQLLDFIKDPLPNSSRSKRFLGVGLYGQASYDNRIKMIPALGVNGFVHLDLNYKIKEESLDSEKSLYIEDRFNNNLRYWYGSTGKDKYSQRELDIFSILTSYSDPKQRKFDDVHNQFLKSNGFRTLDEYMEILLRAHETLKGQKELTSVASLKEKFIEIAEGET